ncbi:MAG: NAD(P)/FAD-dependent oxidoreductase, partial [Propionibacterium sp.]|nr:NAD(P)/FAD-dependent oxidoreductase [Propionibacterium sp.]
IAWLFLHLLYIAGFKQRVTTLVSWALSFVSDGRSQRVVTNQQMIARLAISRLRPGSSARLMRGEQPEDAVADE